MKKIQYPSRIENHICHLIIVVYLAVLGVKIAHRNPKKTTHQ